MWQDIVFLVGSIFSLVVLLPTLADSMANVPLGTALPSAGLGVLYGTTYFTMGMTLSAVGSILIASMWSLIALIRSQHRYNEKINQFISAASTASPFLSFE